MTRPILRIAVPTPLHRSFDYLLPANVSPDSLQPGQRVRVPFGRRTVIGVLLDVVTHSDIEHAKLKRAQAVLDAEPVIGTDILTMVTWASRYYQYPVGEAFATALPVLLRQGQSPEAADVTRWRLT
ncbi:MAG: primosomal protein N', partial [Gammaproteobacteria bacterium]